PQEGPKRVPKQWPRPKVCGDCGKGFRDGASLRRHRRVHSTERPFGCPECGRGFWASASLVTHRRIHTG
ncbi:ZNF34 protein, partial [Xiphorhynchus elegans]|nr:ZNF34 protein [Xiphorhynchus elegans]